MGGQSVFMIEVSKGGQGGTPLPTTSLQTKSESVIVGYYTSAEVPFQSYLSANPKERKEKYGKK